MIRHWLVAAVGIVAWVTAAEAGTDKQDFTEIARGRYLVIAGDCSACHTDPGGKPFAGGRPIETPFGLLVAPNITPDDQTGIGTWTDDQFVAALQSGRDAGGARLYPAMPYTYFTKASRDDIVAMRAYLATIEPVQNPVKSNQLPFPFDIRSTMAIWNTLFFKSGRFVPDAAKSAAWNRGAYLVDGLEHCGMCHTPKNFLGADKNSKALQGGILQGWLSPDITRDPHQGIGTWSPEDIVAYLKTGHNRFAAATGPMAEVVTDPTSQLDDSDLGAIAAYLIDRPPEPNANPAPIGADDPAMKAGQALYIDNCAACHGADGTGIPQLFPALKNSAAVDAPDASDLMNVILRGAKSVATDGTPTGPAMPAFDWKLKDDQAAAVMTYIRNAWGNAAPRVAPGDVAKARQTVAQAAP